MAQAFDYLRIKVRIGDNEAEVSYPLTPRDSVNYHSETSTLLSAVTAIKDIVEVLKSEDDK